MSILQLTTLLEHLVRPFVFSNTLIFLSSLAEQCHTSLQINLFHHNLSLTKVDPSSAQACMDTPLLRSLCYKKCNICNLVNKMVVWYGVVWYIPQVVINYFNKIMFSLIFTQQKYITLFSQRLSLTLCVACLPVSLLRDFVARL